MEMQVETQLSDQIARYLDLATSEAKLTAANMANIDTPGYRAVGMDFEAEMRQAMTAWRRADAARPVRVKAVDGLIARPDGNNVSMDREGLNLAEAQLRFKTGVALLRAGEPARLGRHPCRQQVGWTCGRAAFHLREEEAAMNLFAMMETSGGAMQAERMRAEVVAANMANAETTRTASGGALPPPACGLCRQCRRSGVRQLVECGRRNDHGFGASASGTLAAAPLPSFPAPLLPFNLNGSGRGAGRAYCGGGRGHFASAQAL